MFKYYKIYKPFGVLSQFTEDIPGQSTLAGLFDFPKDVYPIGRLDKDSEGLLLLTNNKKINHRLMDPKWGHHRTYWVQVDGAIKEEDLTPFREGFDVRINKKTHRTQPAKTKIIDHPIIEPRVPPIRVRKNIPTSWIELTLTEGKNRQVRKMCATIGYPTLRLIRYSIENINISSLSIGDVVEIDQNSFYNELQLNNNPTIS